MTTNKIDFVPLIVLLLFVTTGVLLSFFGPISYLGYEKLPVFVFIFSFLVLFSLGYILGLLQLPIVLQQRTKSLELYRLQKVLFWVKLSISIMFFVQLVTLISGILDGTLNLSIAKMGEAYINMYKDYERGTGNISLIFLVQTLTYVPYLVALILGAFYYKQLSKPYKLMLVFIYISIIMIETIGHGKQKQFGDIMVFLLIVSILKVDLFKKKNRVKIFKRVVKFSFLGLVVLLSVLYFRYAALGIGAANINEKVHPLMHYDTKHLIFDTFGDELGFPIAVFTGYLSQGYYGLSLSLQEPFQWTYMVGNSYSLTIFLQRFLHVPLDFHDTYPYRASLHTGWDDSKWSTTFAWFAGDFTFYGTLVFFSLIAFLYAKVWKEAYRYKNPIAILLFANLSIGLLYIPANNQLLHTPGSVIAMGVFLSLWMLKHKKFNFYFLGSSKS